MAVILILLLIAGYAINYALADKRKSAWIDRRTKLTGNGSDHDAAWIELSL